MQTVKKNSILGSVFYQSVYQVMALLVPLITTPIVSRALGAEKLGVYSYSYAIAHYFVIFSMLGISNYGSRTIAQQRDYFDKTVVNFWSLYKLHALLTAICISFFYVYVLFIADIEYRSALLSASLFIWASLFDIQWYFGGTERFKMTATVSTICKIMCCMAIFILIKQPSDISKYIILMGLANVCTNLIPWFYLEDGIRKGFRVKKAIRPHIIPCLVFFVPVVAITIYRYIGKVLLGTMSTMVQTGYYENADKVTQVVLGIIGGIGFVMQQRMSNLYANKNNEEAEQLIDFSMLLTGFISCALSLGLCSISKVLAPVYFGEEFRNCDKLIELLSIEIIYVSFANVIRTNYLIPKEKDKQYVLSVILGAIINVIINIILIPRIGAMGAVLAVMAADFVVFVLQTSVVLNELPIKLYIKKYISFSFIGIIMLIVVRFLGTLMKESVILLLIQILVGGIVYISLSIVYIFRFEQKYWIAIKSLLKNKNV